MKPDWAFNATVVNIPATGHAEVDPLRPQLLRRELGDDRHVAALPDNYIVVTLDR